jgi:hypothetical protein
LRRFDSISRSIAIFDGSDMATRREGAGKGGGGGKGCATAAASATGERGVTDWQADRVQMQKGGERRWSWTVGMQAKANDRIN